MHRRNGIWTKVKAKKNLFFILVKRDDDGFASKFHANAPMALDNAALAEQTRFLNSDGEERFYCPICRNVKYTQVRYLKSHMKLCGQRFHCDICNYDYKQKRSFDLHIKTKHGPVKVKREIQPNYQKIAEQTNWKAVPGFRTNVHLFFCWERLAYKKWRKKQAKMTNQLQM